MDFDTASVLAATNTLWDQITALALTYSFRVIGALILLVAGIVVAGTVQRWSYAALKRMRAFDETLARFFSHALRYAILILVGVTVLAQFGVQTASIIAALGAAGLAIGLALQGTLQNIAAGIMLLVLKPFRVGEFIEAGSLSGTVQEIGLFATELKTGQGVYVLAPNSQLWNTAVTNFNRNPTRSFDLAMRIGYRDDLALALKLLADLARADERVMKSPEPSVFVSELGESWVTLTLSYWTTTPDWWRTRLAMTRAAKEAFEQNGISMPVPKREVRYINQDAPQEDPS